MFISKNDGSFRIVYKAPYGIKKLDQYYANAIKLKKHKKIYESLKIYEFISM